MEKAILENKLNQLGEEMQVIPYVAFERQQARNEREKKLIYKCWAISIIATVFIFVAGFMYFLHKFEATSETTTTTTQEIEGENASIVNDGQYNDNAARYKSN